MQMTTEKLPTLTTNEMEKSKAVNAEMSAPPRGIESGLEKGYQFQKDAKLSPFDHSNETNLQQVQSIAVWLANPAT